MSIQAQIKSIANTAKVGDIVTVNGSARTVTEVDPDGRYIYVDSGKVRDGRKAGGLIDSEWCKFHPTMAQKPVAVSEISLLSAVAVAS